MGDSLFFSETPLLGLKPVIDGEFEIYETSTDAFLFSAPHLRSEKDARIN